MACSTVYRNASQVGRRALVMVRPLTNSERTQLEAGLHSADVVIRRRCQLLLASAQGERVPQIARRLGYNDRAIRETIHAFNASGLACLHRQGAKVQRGAAVRLAADSPPSPSTFSPPSPLPIDTEYLTDLGMKLWRLDRRVQQLARRDESAELQQLARRFEELKDAVVRGAAIEMHDYTGQRYDPGLTVCVLTYQPTEGISAGQEVILETVKPTVYYRGRLIAPGEVVVGVSMPKEM